MIEKRVFVLYGCGKGVFIEHLESVSNGCGKPRKNALNKRPDEPDPSRAEEEMRAAAPATRKPNMSEPAGHQSGRRVLEKRFPPQRKEGSV